ncbi:RIP metalloprotease RseP [Aureivirga sp. CE67]|uniref:RIP metalloprotease RseP n=1 Tax=Aureivirga sp. CE67 TaxID=1788983 RepID=UPI0018C90FA6|nr:RIP metalloprotease RseP [Aureivirga sp. CE67]
MEILIRASQFLLSLSLLIVLHELGHFIPARLFGTRVEKFYLFFDYKYSLFKKKIGDTVYGIGWIPLGGYVKISGMIDESMDTEQMKEEPKPWEFRSKPAWQRLIIMLGGVTVNFILGILIYIMILFVWGREYVSPEAVKDGFSVAEVMKPFGFKDGDQILKVNGQVPFNVLDVNADLLLKDVKTIEVKHLDGQIQTINLPEDIGMKMWTSGDVRPFVPRIYTTIDTVYSKFPAEKAGFKKNDKVVAINGAPIKYWDQFKSIVSKDTLNPLNIVVSRNGVEKTLTVKAEKGKIGVAPVTKYPFEPEIKTYTFGESIPAGTDLAVETLDNYISQFKYVFTAKGASSLGGFMSIANGFSTTWDWRIFWSFTAFLSIMLAFMNLLPIPALDGGHVVFTLFEMITGRKPNEKFLEYAQIVGIIILFSLLLYANGNDVYKWLVAKGIF